MFVPSEFCAVVIVTVYVVHTEKSVGWVIVTMVLPPDHAVTVTPADGLKLYANVTVLIASSNVITTGAFTATFVAPSVGFVETTVGGGAITVAHANSERPVVS